MHISDGILSVSTCAAGYVAAGGLVAAGLRKARNADVARGGLLTASFFLAGLVRVPLGGTSVHLLLGSLNGIALGAMCFPSIFLALLLQALLLGHGGMSTIGVNTLIMGLPAYLCGLLFHQGIRRGISPWPLFTLSLAAVFSLGPKLLADSLHGLKLARGFDPSWAIVSAAGIALALITAAALKYAAKLDEVHAWGFGAGSASVIGSALLFVLVLSFAPLSEHIAREGIVALAGFAFISHMPVILVEGALVALLIKYLDTVSPELLRLDRSLASGLEGDGGRDRGAESSDAHANEGNGGEHAGARPGKG